MTSIIARIERIREGHSERALIHAVGAEGHEYKIEVPPADVRMLSPDQPYMLVLSWSIHVSPIAVTAAVSASPSDMSSPAASSPAPASSIAASPRSVDAQFMALMNRTTAPTDAVQASGSPLASTTDQQLASLLGVPSGTSKPTT